MDILLLTPEWTLVAFSLAIILLELFIKDRAIIEGITICGLVISMLVSLIFLINLPVGNTYFAFNGMLNIDHIALIFNVVFTGAAILVVLASKDYFISRFQNNLSEYFALIMVSTTGMMLMAAANELITIYLSLELAGISLYVLAGYLKDNTSAEASLKYLLLGALASAVFLYGMALVFGFTGTTQLNDIALYTNGIQRNPILIAGIILLMGGLGFKIGAVPFHMWIPDVYEGAPTPVTAFLSVASKAAGFAVIMRTFITAFSMPTWLSQDWGTIFAILAVITMLTGNIIAIPQTNIKRMLGYSSIAQAGYIMVGLAALGVSQSTVSSGQSSILFFLISYTLTNLGAFISIIIATNAIRSDLIIDFSGLGKRSPLLALALTLCLISLIGMPPAAGFIAKFYIFRSAIQGNLLWLVIIAVLNSVISAYYYLRVVKVMWLGRQESEEKIPSSWPLKLALGISCLGVLVLGIIPGSLMHVAQLAANIF